MSDMIDVKKIRYYAAIGEPGKHSGLECEVFCELRVGDYIEIRHGENQDEDHGDLVVIKTRYYCTIEHIMFFYGERVGEP